MRYCGGSASFGRQRLWRCRSCFRSQPPTHIPFLPTRPSSIRPGTARSDHCYSNDSRPPPADELNQAHAYAYGGCIIQDLGYYPFGSKFFSDLTHYVRGGDFVLNLIRDSQDLNEYAFALGALSHYAADNHGHPMAVNRAVPLFYPELGRKFGKLVTYADDPFSHGKTEFAFDVFQAAKGRYASAAYKNFIGFEVAKPLLERAFQDTYGMRLEKVFMNVDLAIGSYRRAVGSVLPAMTRVAWQIRKQEIRKDAPSVTRKTFLYNLSRSSYERNWGSTYQRPGIRSRFLAYRIPHLAKGRPVPSRCHSSD